jgi:hypothetical protein
MTKNNFNIPLNVVEWCGKEVFRQQESALHVHFMAKAWAYAVECSLAGISSISEGDIRHLNGVIVGSSYDSSYRTTPVTIKRKLVGVPPRTISHAVENLVRYQDNITSDVFVKEFLDIHPFGDGNGRTAAVMYNWKRKTLEYPLELPDFYSRYTLTIVSYGDDEGKVTEVLKKQFGILLGELPLVVMADADRNAAYRIYDILLECGAMCDLKKKES